MNARVLVRVSAGSRARSHVSSTSHVCVRRTGRVCAGASPCVKVSGSASLDGSVCASVSAYVRASESLSGRGRASASISANLSAQVGVRM